MKTIKNLIIATAILTSFSAQAEEKYSSPSLCAEVRDLAEVMMLSHQGGLEFSRVYKDIKDLHGATNILVDAYSSEKVAREDKLARAAVSKEFAGKWYVKCMDEGI